MSRLRLFVYGSLKRGFAHHAELGGAELEAAIETARGFRLVLAGAYPALLRGGDGRVRGELYRVPPELLAELDAFEGCPDLYRREVIALADGTQAFAYLMGAEQSARCTEIESGEWLES